MTRIGWVDCSSGVSGDMLLGALSSVGALDALPDLVASLSDLGVTVDIATTDRGGLHATSVTVTAVADQPHRTLQQVREIVDGAAVPEPVKSRALAVFDRLAVAEAGVHGTSIDEVEFHEVGAVDSIVDVLGACLGIHALGLDRLLVSPIALGGGTADSGHGKVPVPTPAALALLAGTSLIAAGGGEVELATPTGIALLAEWATDSGWMPQMRVRAVGAGAGGRDLPDQPNVVRFVVGETAADGGDEQWLVVETNVDDLDPRLWPGVLAALLEAGAADAWLTPILMKKGRPAHTLSALVAATGVEAIQQAMFLQTSTIGLRWHTVGKHALERTVITVDIDGLEVRVKVAFADGRVVSATPEFDDIAAAAASLGAPTKEVLAAAIAAVRGAVNNPA
ncbi:MAG TPA: nickel pincer cofactor biosynthesis protein LarC [Mycobacteriales bacterium]|nr:nickel pincer cofactor biosynthesis protein LarC [Mycobacteriales bacterium]